LEIAKEAELPRDSLFDETPLLLKSFSVIWQASILPKTASLEFSKGYCLDPHLLKTQFLMECLHNMKKI